jgi:hypothetical protein
MQSEARLMQSEDHLMQSEARLTALFFHRMPYITGRSEKKVKMNKNYALRDYNYYFLYLRKE